jgi:predicted dehydrogenase
MFHLALWTLGDVAAVTAQLGFHVPRVRPDGVPFTMANDSARVLLEFASGAQASVEVSAVAHVDGLLTARSTVYGELGTLEGGWTLTRDLSRIEPFLRGSFTGSDERIDESGWSDTADYLTAHPGARQFIDAIVDGAPLAPGLDMGYKVQQLIDAAQRSHAEGHKVLIAP